MQDIFTQHQLNILDEKGNETGNLKWYLDVHRDGDWHRGVHVYIITDVGEVLIHKRSAFVHTYPNLWENSCGGHVDIGETSLETAQKETKEELGIGIQQEQFVLIKTIVDQFSYNTTLHGMCINNEFDDIFIVQIPDKNITLNTSKDEVAETRWVYWKDLKNEIEKYPEIHVPRWEEYKVLFEYIDRFMGGDK